MRAGGGHVMVGVTAFATDTETGADVVTLPASSRATAVRLCVPFVLVAVFQRIVNGEVTTSMPRLTPSRRNCTPATPTLSAAVALIAIVPETAAAGAGAVIETVGALTSAAAVNDVATTSKSDVPSVQIRPTWLLPTTGDPAM